MIGIVSVSISDIYHISPRSLCELSPVYTFPHFLSRDLYSLVTVLKPVIHFVDSCLALIIRAGISNTQSSVTSRFSFGLPYLDAINHHPLVGTHIPLKAYTAAMRGELT
jgi:hypothetical protein